MENVQNDQIYKLMLWKSSNGFRLWISLHVNSNIVMIVIIVVSFRKYVEDIIFNISIGK